MHTIAKVFLWLAAALGLVIVVLLTDFGLSQTHAGKT